MTSKIEWTGETWNPMVGCTVHSEGCKGCYAMRDAYRKQFHPNDKIRTAYDGVATKTKGGQILWTGKVNFSETALLKPLSWKKPRLIFVNSMSDLFHESVTDEQRDRVFAVMALCPQHTFQVLTKRADRMREYFAGAHLMERIDCDIDVLIEERVDPLNRKSDDLRATACCIEESWPLPNVWLGVSVENQAAADERIPDLLATPAAVRWISAEPLLGPVDLRKVPNKIFCGTHDSLRGLFHWAGGPIRKDTRIDWVVAGGESGPNARPMHPDWARSLRDQCAAAGVPFLFKQWGAWGPVGCVENEGIEDINRGITKWAYGHFDHQKRFELTATARSRNGHVDEAYGLIGDGTPQSTMWHVGKSRAGRLLDGVRHDEYPAGYTREATP